MRESILEVAAVPKSRLSLYSCFVNLPSARWTKRAASLNDHVASSYNKSLFAVQNWPVCYLEAQLTPRSCSHDTFAGLVDLRGVRWSKQTYRSELLNWA